MFLNSSFAGSVILFCVWKIETLTNRLLRRLNFGWCRCLQGRWGKHGLSVIWFAAYFFLAGLEESCAGDLWLLGYEALMQPVGSTATVWMRLEEFWVPAVKLLFDNLFSNLLNNEINKNQNTQ